MSIDATANFTVNGPNHHSWSELEPLSVVAGPSKYDLLTAFALCYPDQRTERAAMKVSFDTEGNGPNFLATIRALGHEDNSGESFLFDGIVYETKSSCRFVIQRPCTGYFNTRTRHGWIKVGESGQTYYHGQRA